MSDSRTTLRELLAFLYGESEADGLSDAVLAKVETFRHQYPHLADSGSSPGQLDERDVVLITYGDQFREPERPPLRVLGAFLEEYLADVVSGVHILPFFPYSSDDGFSVIDYTQVDPALGTWQDIAALGEHRRLAFDLVVNHVSAESEWFRKFLAGEQPYTGYFPVLDPETDLSAVVRPRATPVLTPFQTADGVQHVWTTFSADQIDLEYGNPHVMLEMIDVLLFYVAHGAQIIRLDAIAYLWKIPGTSCIHLPQTHAVVKLFRAILDLAAPAVLLLTETNVPHQENISYFGAYLPDRQRTDEAQMVYQFSLAPLILHTFLAGDSTRLAAWAQGLPKLPVGTTFFNFTASHDGIGVRPAEGLLAPAEIQRLVEATLAHGGRVSYKANPDGSQSAYELNVTWYDALNDPAQPAPIMDVARFLASQAIMLALAGVPGIYVHSLFGSRDCQRCLQETGRARSLNRAKFALPELQEELCDPASLKSQVIAGYRHLLEVRKRQPALHPGAGQRVLALGSHVFAVLRTAADGRNLLCVTNVRPESTRVQIGLSEHGLAPGMNWVDVLSGDVFGTGGDVLAGSLGPYQVRWLRS
jgi:sucrose phosphorylase